MVMRLGNFFFFRFLSGCVIKIVRLCDLDIPKDKWLNYLQTVEILI